MDIEVRELCKSFPSASGAPLDVLDNVSFRANHGETIAIIGPSGCGKTTLLKIIAGLERPDDGSVNVQGVAPACLPIVWQELRLLPWLSAVDNISFPLTLKPLPIGESNQRVADLVRDLGLSGFEQFYPWQLSGGLAQRVAIGRALVVKSDVLLLDEPFSSLDYQTKQGLFEVLAALRRANPITVLFVSHDLRDAICLADRILVLGRRPAKVIEEVESPSSPIERIELESRFAALLR